MKKFIGKPYAGKPHVRIDEGEKRQRRFSLLYWPSVVKLSLSISATGGVLIFYKIPSTKLEEDSCPTGSRYLKPTVYSFPTEIALLRAARSA
ncbi:hypothetical protein Halhy_0865 [Haliscomenobacter hydrossis DSM 1100]|uniref:Uncharacterized protein n=1 Tax=Haliscomenobacter hydrossis (strain ATCC 27775 / DSM 1100 / LMG 10767 / O) TaxID=760192 RepID=F4L549_HALH1|nr:hypothetical protein Halhy_0865 [Haliscomenobacter hydrossis DSM 1100]